MSSDEHYASSSWIKGNIHKKECCFFQDLGEDICKCGYLKTKHTDEAIKAENYTGDTWDRDKHVHEVPTDAFGEIRFDSGDKTSKYARVSTDTKPEVLYRLLTEQWNLSPPNLLISVTGGTKDFNMTPQLKKMFHRGLIKVAETIGAWIITGGTNEGVMKHVGHTVKDYALSSSIHGKNIVAIGVAPWGVIHNRDALVNKDGCFPAHYMTDTEGQGDLSCLDSNHSHFLLVDDGTHGHYEGEVELRTSLEKYISEQRFKYWNLTIPVVCVVLEGGPDALNTMYNAMMNDTPCVVLKRSGGIADVIAQVSKLPVSQITTALIRQLMEKCFGSVYIQFSDLKILEWTKKIQDIIRMSHLLTIFTAIKDNHEDLDAVILEVLFKASRSSELREDENWKRQLFLAISFNRVDIAEEIFTEEREWEDKDLNFAFFFALEFNNPQFLSLLLENGLSLSNDLFDDELFILYMKMPNCAFQRKLRERWRHQVGDLTPISEIVRHLLGEFTQNIYKEDIDHPINMPKDEEVPLSEDQAHKDNKVQRDASTDLFLWAVVQNNKEMAEIAWKQCRDCITAALAASKILKKMAEEESDADEVQKMLDLASDYENHAIGVFNKCHDNDKEHAQKLLVRVSPFWGRTTCLRLAVEADDKNFVAQSGVQAVLTQIWCGELSVDNPVWKVLICMVFFPLIYTEFVGFRRVELIKSDEEEMEEEETETGCTRSTILSCMRCWSKLKNCCYNLGNFYSSPQVKFYWNVVSYLAFLFLFAVVLMMDFQSTPSPAELMLCVWLLSLVCEEVRQLFDDPDGFGFYKKFKMYIKDLWNILDVLSILLFALGLAFRLTSEWFYTGKILLCIDYMVFCVRLMAIFTISQTLGPKIIIVGRMMRDMFFFMFLLSIWVVAFGVAKQGILIHNDNRLDWIIRGAVYEPYLVLFGNFPTDIDNTAFDINSCSMNGTDPLKPKCPVLNENKTPVFPAWVTIIMLCVYLLFANILLLNLLIAIFNFTVQEVHDNTDRVWKFQRYELIKEYHSRLAAPPPLNILGHLWLFIQRIVLRKSPDQNKQFKNELHPMKEKELLSWEALMKDRYLRSAQQNQIQSMEQRFLDTAQKVTIITKQLEREEESLSAVLKKLAKLEEQIMTKKTTESENCFHVKSRQFHYPNCKITRFPVPDEKVPWEVSFSSYEPPYYDSEDGGSSIDGSKDLNNYRNPEGRTGICGRGALSRFGPNLHLELVLTRWSESKKSVLEYLGVRDKSKQLLSLPGGFVDSADQLPTALKEILGNELYETLNAKLSEGKKVSEGYTDDCRNTDNAWVETTVLNIHLDQTSQVGRRNNLIQWQKVSREAKLNSNQRDSLQKVAELHDWKF